MKFRKDLIDIMLSGGVVRCRTEDQAEMLLKELVKHDIKWWGGITIIPSVTEWGTYKARTCYALKGPFALAYGRDFSYESSEHANYKIIEFEDLLEDQVNNDLSTKVDDMINNLILQAGDKAEAYKEGYIRACEDLSEKIKDIL